MDENTWKIIQVAMWLLGLQTTIIIAILGAVYASLSKKIEKLDSKIEKLEIQGNDIDKRLFGIETMLHMKDCCVLKDERTSLKKVE